MPRQITKDATPGLIREMAEEYQRLLTRSGVRVVLEQTISDMERQAARANDITVEEWRDRQKEIG